MFVTSSMEYNKSSIDVCKLILLRFYTVTMHCEYSCYRLTDENSPSAAYYLRTNEFSEAFLKWALIAINSISLGTSYFSSAANAIFYYIRDGNVDMENLYLPMKLRYLWETCTPLPA